jgi:cobalt-zinc-cadmium resistance protein CzcA
MNRLIAFALKQRFFVIGGALTLVIGGLYALTHLPFDAFPDLTGTRVEVITPAPGMPPEDIERLVTYPIESSLMGIPRAEGVRSVSKQGLSIITVSFPDDVDVYFARQLVQQRLADAKGALPTGIERGSDRSPRRWASCTSTRSRAIRCRSPTSRRCTTTRSARACARSPVCPR